jgi:hypothetical protein
LHAGIVGMECMHIKSIGSSKPPSVPLTLPPSTVELD